MVAVLQQPDNNNNRLRAWVFVDGFNLYHSIDELCLDPRTNRRVHRKHHLKWLDIASLSRALLHPNRFEIVGVTYYSAFANWIPQDQKERHQAYLGALRSTGVETVMGQFKNKPRTCPSCKHKWTGHEEKETDVNMALGLLERAVLNSFDVALLYTADTDIAPAIRTVKRLYPEKQLFVAISQRRQKYATELKQLSDQLIRLQEHHFLRSQFPAQIVLPDGKIISRPAKYTPPA